ncbi:hypothetical protein TWF694_002970 [Orbilia ellipsospora]|uniref:Uncharacterized protein n=1 Tax=Orbilia ellipsospora TaxID=2528407 RepID=A0AAV9X142_9PEZI
MRSRFYATALLAMLYAAPVLGVALAHPKAQHDTIDLEVPNEDTVDAIAESSADDREAELQPPDDEEKAETAAEGEEKSSPGDQNVVETPPISEEAGEDAVDTNKEEPKTVLSQSQVEDAAAIASNITDDSSAADVHHALANMTNSQLYSDQIGMLLSTETNKIADKVDSFQMEPRFAGPRGTLEAHMSVLHDLKGELEGGTSCQEYYMEWMDPEHHDTVSLTLGGTFVMGIHAYLFRDPSCKERIDQGADWPGQEYNYAPGASVPFYYQWIILTEGQYFGTEKLPDGTYLKKIYKASDRPNQ